MVDRRKLMLPPRSVFAGVLLWAMGYPSGTKPLESPTIGDLSEKIVELKENLSLDTTDISIRADKGGWISDDLSSFVNRFVLFGLATKSPFDISLEAQRDCEEILLEDHERDPRAVEQLAENLGLQLNWDAGPAPA